MRSWDGYTVKSVGAETGMQIETLNIVVSQMIVKMSHRRVFR